MKVGPTLREIEAKWVRCGHDLSHAERVDRDFTPCVRCSPCLGFKPKDQSAADAAFPKPKIAYRPGVEGDACGCDAAAYRHEANGAGGFGGPPRELCKECSVGALRHV